MTLAPPKSIILLSHAGTNIGDDLVAEVLYTQTAKIFPTARISSYTVNPIRFPTQKFHSLYPFSRSGIANMLRFVKELFDTQLVVGFWAIQDFGSCYFASTNLLLRWTFFWLFPRLFKVDTAFVNVDAVQLKTYFGRYLAKQVFSRSSLLIFRNDASRKATKALADFRDFPVTSDIGFLFAGHISEAPRCDLITINFLPSETYIRRLIPILDKFFAAIPIKQIAFLAMHSEDEKTFRFLQAQLSDHQFDLYSPQCPADAWKLVQSSKAFLGMRLHAQILGLVSETPTFMLGYHDKNYAIAQAANNLHRFSFVSDPTSVQKKLQTFTDDISRSTKNSCNSAQVPDISLACQKANRTFTLLEKYWEGR